jgi:glutamate dehydrogenase
MYADGFKIVGVSDIYGGIYNANGLDIAKLQEHLKTTGSVKGFEDSNAVTNEQLLELDCDILIPAAVQNVINLENADKIKAKIVVEAANGPVTPEADEILMKKGVTIIPDVLANSGSAIVCHFERIQGLTDDYWELDTVRERLKGKILKAYGEVLATSEKMGISMRDAAWVNAVSRIGEAVKLRGWA